MSAPLVMSSIEFLNNPACFKDNFKVSVTFEAHEYLPKDAEWQLIYVGNGGDEAYDQVLDSVIVGPIEKGRHKFEFEVSSALISEVRIYNLVHALGRRTRCF